ncbi:MAG: carboxypeptidase regulatory-like domain-containing protein [Terracidiphilus sp.]|nr:carboxypeptidase regulatory-like domain-containing protein [Terracidiphilus sp.]
MTFALRLRPRGAVRIPVAIGLVALVLATAHPQDPTPPQQPDQQSDPDEGRDIGWIYGIVTSPTGAPMHGGTVSLSTDGGITLRYNITVSPKGDYTGRVPLGEYTLVYRAPGAPEGKVTDLIHSVVIYPGKGIEQNVDMTRQEYYDRLSPEDQEKLRQMKESNDSAAATNKLIASINADIETANRDFADAANARATAIQTLGSTASAYDVDSQAADIRFAKYTEIESLMSKATAEIPNEAELWIDLGRAQVGLKNYLDAETSFKKALDLISQAANTTTQASNSDPQAASPSPQATNPDPQLIAAANAGLGEVYARTRMVDEANASVAAAVKADPAHAAMYLRNLAVIFFQEKNILAQIDAADDAIKANPKDAFLYFVKAQGLAVNAPIDPATNKIKLSPECLVAFREYLGLAPGGEYAAQVTTILENADPENASPATTETSTNPASPPAQTNPPVQK